MGALPERVALAESWRRLDATGEHSFFLSWTWIGTWLSSLPAHLAPQLLQAQRGGETTGQAILLPRQTRLRGILPIRQLCFNATGDDALDRLTIEHNGFAGTENDAELWPAFLAWFAREVKDIDELVVPGLAFRPEPDPDALPLLAREREVKAYCVKLTRVASDIETILSRNARQQLRRSARAYEKSRPITLDAAPNVKTAHAYYAAMKTFHTASATRRGRANPFLDSYFDTFHLQLMDAGIPNGDVEILRIRTGTHAIGYLYNFRRKGRTYSYQSGFDDADPDLRPGYVCHAAAISHCASRGDTSYDFMAGYNQLKRTFAPEPYAMYWQQWRKPRLGFRAEDAARATVETLRRLTGR